MAFQKKTLTEQLAEYAPNFVDEVVKLSVPEIKGKIADLSIADSEIEESMKEDEDLKKCKEALDVAREGYNDMLTANRLKKKFLIRMLKDRGAPKTP